MTPPSNDQTRPPPWIVHPLTAREKEIAILVAHGLSNRQIAETLGLRPSTVASHLASIFKKLKLRSRAQVATLVGAAWGRNQTREDQRRS